MQWQCKRNESRTPLTHTYSLDMFLLQISSVHTMPYQYPSQRAPFLRQSLLSLRWIVHDARHITCKGSSNSNFVHIVTHDREFMFFLLSFPSIGYYYGVCGCVEEILMTQRRSLLVTPYEHTTHTTHHATDITWHDSLLQLLSMGHLQSLMCVIERKIETPISPLKKNLKIKHTDGKHTIKRFKRVRRRDTQSAHKTHV